VIAPGGRLDGFGFAGFMSDCEPGFIIMLSERADLVLDGVRPLNDRTYATSSQIF
jgi:hypothetical protein